MPTIEIRCQLLQPKYTLSENGDQSAHGQQLGGRGDDREILTSGFKVPSPKVPSRTQKKVTVAVKVFATTYERTPNLHFARNSA